MYKYIYRILLSYMQDDPYFCMCGCSSWQHNFKRILIKLKTKLCTKK